MPTVAPKRSKKAIVKQPIDKSAFETALNAELDKIRALMLKEWGYAPELKPEIETALVVRVNFNIKGFTHKGRSLIINESNIQKHRKPHLAARIICSEIVAHRNTCADCGDGIASLYHRAIGGGYWSMDQNAPDGFMLGYDRDPETNEVKRPLLMLNVPPDAVEMLLAPVVSKRVQARIDGLPPEKRQKYVCKVKPAAA
jgi:hypothetical protein